MPERPIIVDTGPLVAFLIARESRHGWAAEQFRSLPAPFITCEPVLAEAFHLLRRSRGNPSQLFELLNRGMLIVDFKLSIETPALDRLMHKYEDLPMSLPDACLVRMAELRPTARVLTFDGHFRLYRKHNRQPIAALMPEE